jgi:protein O-GlcNAc transferase
VHFAPIQVRYLGLAGTTGAEFFDYIITDKIVTPEDDACFYTEQFVYLPHCYQINDNTQTISKKSWRRSDVGLPETGFVFCSFNQGYKIDPIMFDGWMNILREIPEGVLWLQPGNKAAKKNLKQKAENRGIKSDRIIFAEPLPKEEHLARLRLADLALDTRVVNGAATTSDALWVGVPVITLQGRHFASRMSSSILTAIGATHMVTHNMQEYQSLAVDLARDPARMDAIRRKIAKNRWTKPLFDTRRFVGNLEKAYRKMWQIYLLGERPEMIKVVEN